MRAFSHFMLHYTLLLFRTIIDPTKKATPKPTSTAKESHGNGCSKAAARMHWLECVNGKAYNAAFKASGMSFKEKKVPLRKVIGKRTKALKVFKP
jgi:hypothetical protein